MKLDINGIEVYWETHGDGEPLLWLHGGMGFGADWRHVLGDGGSWRPPSPSPPPGFQLIAPDLRGHGATTGGSSSFSFRQCALDVLALLRHLNVPRVKAIGLSGGGIVLLHMATMNPASLRGAGAPGLEIEAMVVVSAPPYFPIEARAIMRQYSEAMISEAEMARMRQRHVRGEAQIKDLIAMVRGFADRYDDVSFTPPQLATISAGRSSCSAIAIHCIPSRSASTCIARFRSRTCGWSPTAAMDRSSATPRRRSVARRSRSSAAGRSAGRAALKELRYMCAYARSC
ncbi:MAG TPA: alpha/beta hydrolase, partial [Vicinamibacterales bacterium]|nr:alpha/beta hydrolase [Vicinamibacterales bacterium]